MIPDACIILFVKAPIPGRVKTRLTQNLDETVVAALYRCFVHDIICKITDSGLPLQIFYDPPDSESMMRGWLGEDRLYVPQEGGNLGERMAQAFQHVFNRGMKRAILMGSDLPDLPGEIFADALSALGDHQAVIGPSMDGGYYLIGFQAGGFTPAAFNNIHWSSETVYDATMKRLTLSGLSFRKLTKWQDIDTREDLLTLIESLKKQPGHAPETAAYLKQLGMIDD